MIKRNTVVSQKIKELFEKSSHPMTAPTILNQLTLEGLSPNKSTVYRILEKLLSDNVIEAITLRHGSRYFELTSKRHHHHFFCNSCETLYCLSSCHVEKLNINLNSLLPRPDFKINTHDFNLYGQCNRCLTPSSS